MQTSAQPKPVKTLRGKEVATAISQRTGISLFTSWYALRAWVAPITKKRNLTLYHPDAVEDVIRRFASGEWPERKPTASSESHR